MPHPTRRSISSPVSSSISLPSFSAEEIVYSDAQIMANLERSYARDWKPRIEATQGNLQGSRQGNMQGSMYVFAYGSLIFRPDFDYAERRIACVRGFRRCFGLWSGVYRGTMERPGLVLGLDGGGCCWGVAYRLQNNASASKGASQDRGEPYKTLQKLWRREMFTDAYEPRALCVIADDGTRLAPCLGFVLNRASNQYAGNLDERTRLHAIEGAHGTRGSNLDYLLDTQRSLAHANLRCSHIDGLAKKLVKKSTKTLQTEKS